MICKILFILRTSEIVPLLKLFPNSHKKMKSTLSLIPEILIFYPCLVDAIIRPNAWEPRWHETCFEKMQKWQLHGIDPSFLARGKELYVPYLSRLKLNRLSSAISGIPMEDIFESELYYNSCIKLKINSATSFNYTGFGGKSVEYVFESYKRGKNRFQGKYSRTVTSEADEGGISHITMTDNKTYAFMPDCTLDNKRTWSVVSTTPYLSGLTLAEIHKHAMSIGFKKEYFTSIRYSCCKRFN